MENNGWRTVPMIFIDDKFIGGFDDTNKLQRRSIIKITWEIIFYE